MGIVLFDWKSPTACKKVKNALLTRVCLFDGYLTESTSYPHFQGLVYLIEKGEINPCQYVKAYQQRVCLFDGYLTEPKTESRWK
jgi:hypothetical protein